MDSTELPDDLVAEITKRYELGLKRVRELSAEVHTLHGRLIATGAFLQEYGVEVEEPGEFIILRSRPSRRVREKHEPQMELEDRAPVPRQSKSAGAEQVLREMGKAMHYGEIWEELVKRGHTSKAARADRAFLATLSRDDRFVNVGLGLWDLAERAHHNDVEAPSEAPDAQQHDERR